MERMIEKVRMWVCMHSPIPDSKLNTSRLVHGSNFNNQIQSKWNPACQKLQVKKSAKIEYNTGWGVALAHLKFWEANNFG